MAGAFLNQLVTIQVPEDGNCIICMEAYGTTFSESGTAEKAVRLPCALVFGSECITLWLCPEKYSQNPCPCCRSEPFALPKKEEDIDDESEEDEPARRVRLCREGWDVFIGILSTQGSTTLEAQWLQGQRDWTRSATQLEHGSLEKAMAARNLLQNQLGMRQEHFDGLETAWPIEELALSLQTMRFREFSLYNQLVTNSSRHLQIPPDRSI